jgi:hypothetical protein
MDWIQLDLAVEQLWAFVETVTKLFNCVIS